MGFEGSKYENPQILPLKETGEEKIARQLREKFEKVERINLYEGAETLNVRDIQPDKLKTDIPTIVMKGWGTTPYSYRDNILGLAERGRRVLAIDNIYGIKETEAREGDLERAKELGLEGLMLDKVVAYLKMLDEKRPLEQVDVVAHSEGAIHAIYAAMLRPEIFRSLVLVDPAGMVGEDNKKRLLLGSAIDLLYLQARNLYKRLGLVGTVKRSNMLTKELGKSIQAGPQKSWETIGVITKTKIHELLALVRSQGVKISIIHSVDDRFFSMEDVQKMTKKEMIDGFYSIKGTHNEIYSNPGAHTPVIDNALDSLEALYKKEMEVAA